MTDVNYDDRLFANYHRGRAIDEPVMRLWREAIRRCVGDRSGLTVLDLGSGTGRYSAALANELDSQVLGVEPSDKMRAVAEAECEHSDVRFLKGSAEDIPLNDDSVDVVWMSQVVHHLTDLETVARELKRVVRRAGLLLIRSNFKGRLRGFARFYEFFSVGLAIDEARHPSVEQVQRIFESNGFRFDRLETVEQLVCHSLKEYSERLRLRTYSTFELMSEEEFESGMRALESAAQSEERPEPVMAKLDLLVFQRV